jgi:hypothetical protein
MLSIHDRTITTAAWLRRIRAANTSDKMLGIVREYLETWSPEDIARLPEDCRPDVPVAESIGNLALQLREERVAENFILHVEWCAKYPLFTQRHDPSYRPNAFGLELKQFPLGQAQGLENPMLAIRRYLGVRRACRKAEKEKARETA